MFVTMSDKIPAHYPEGPYVYNGVLHWVEYTKNTVCNEEGMRHELPYYGPCGLASFKGELVVACYDAHLIYFINSGITLDIPYPNDMIEDDKGGLFITSSATIKEGDPFTTDSSATGGIYYLDKDNTMHKLLIDRPIHYANGVAFSDNCIYVSEHLKNRVLKYEVFYDRFSSVPALGETQIHISLPRDLYKDALLGPDGLCLDKQRGNMYVAHFGSGKLLVYNDQRLVDTYEVDHSYITNVCMLDEGHVCITVANGGEAGYVGRIGLKK